MFTASIPIYLFFFPLIVLFEQLTQNFVVDRQNSNRHVVCAKNQREKIGCLYFSQSGNLDDPGPMLIFQWLAHQLVLLDYVSHSDTLIIVKLQVNSLALPL